MNSFCDTIDKAGQSPHGRMELSSSLKERLKRCGRYHARSPDMAHRKGCHSNSSEMAGTLSHSSRNLPNPLVRKDLPSALDEPALPSLHSQPYPHQGLYAHSKNKPMIETPNLWAENSSSIEDCTFQLKRKMDDPTGENQSRKSKSALITHLCVQDERNMLAMAFHASEEKNNLCDTDSVEKGHKLNKDDNCLNSRGGIEPDAGADATSHNPKMKGCSAANVISSQAKCPIKFGGKDNVGKHSQSQFQRLQLALDNKLELLRKLKMVKMYRSKNDLTQLQELIDRWRSVSQAGLTDLLALHPDPRPSMVQLIDHLHIDADLVQYDVDMQEFS